MEEGVKISRANLRLGGGIIGSNLWGGGAKIIYGESLAKIFSNQMTN